MFRFNFFDSTNEIDKNNATNNEGKTIFSLLANTFVIPNVGI